MSFPLWFVMSPHPWCVGSWVRTSSLTQLWLPPCSWQVLTTPRRAAGLEAADSYPQRPRGAGNPVAAPKLAALHSTSRTGEAPSPAAAAGRCPRAAGLSGLTLPRRLAGAGPEENGSAASPPARSPQRQKAVCSGPDSTARCVPPSPPRAPAHGEAEGHNLPGGSRALSPPGASPPTPPRAPLCPSCPRPFPFLPVPLRGAGDALSCFPAWHPPGPTAQKGLPSTATLSPPSRSWPKSHRLIAFSTVLSARKMCLGKKGERKEKERKNETSPWLKRAKESGSARGFGSLSHQRFSQQSDKRQGERNRKQSRSQRLGRLWAGMAEGR